MLQTQSTNTSSYLYVVPYRTVKHLLNFDVQPPKQLVCKSRPRAPKSIVCGFYIKLISTACNTKEIPRLTIDTYCTSPVKRWTSFARNSV